MAPIVASYLFGVPAQTAPYFAIGTAIAESSTVTGVITNEAKVISIITQNAA